MDYDDDEIQNAIAAPEPSGPLGLFAGGALLALLERRRARGRSNA